MKKELKLSENKAIKVQIHRPFLISKSSLYTRLKFAKKYNIIGYLILLITDFASYVNIFLVKTVSRLLQLPLQKIAWLRQIIFFQDK